MIVIYSFFRPTKVPLYLKITGTNLGGWSETHQDNISNALKIFISTLKIGQSTLIGRLWQTIMSQMGTQDIMTVTQIQISNDGTTWQTTDYEPGLIEKNNLPVENITWLIADNT